MQITLDTSNADDVKLLGKLAEAFGGSPTPAAAPAEKAPRKSAAAKTAAAAEPEPTPEPPADSGGATMDDAVARATELVSAGKAAQVKEALSKLGAGRVSELGDDQLDAFLAELKG